MEDDSGLLFLGGIVLIGALLIVIVQVIVMIVTAVLVVVALLVGVVVAALFFAGTGVLANLAVRTVLGAWGDRQGESSKRQVYFGLALLHGLPLEFWFVALEMMFFAPRLGWRLNDYWVVIGLGLFFLSTPAYYAAWWAKEVPELHIKLEVAYRFDDTMRAEQAILWTRLQTWALITRVQVRIWWKEFGLSTRLHLREWYARGLGFLARSFYRIHIFFLTRSKEVQHGTLGR